MLRVVLECDKMIVMQAEPQKETEEKARLDLERKRSAERHLAEVCLAPQELVLGL